MPGLSRVNIGGAWRLVRRSVSGVWKLLRDCCCSTYDPCGECANNGQRTVRVIIANATAAWSYPRPWTPSGEYCLTQTEASCIWAAEYRAPACLNLCTDALPPNEQTISCDRLRVELSAESGGWVLRVYLYSARVGFVPGATTVEIYTASGAINGTCAANATLTGASGGWFTGGTAAVQPGATCLPSFPEPCPGGRYLTDPCDDCQEPGPRWIRITLDVPLLAGCRSTGATPGTGTPLSYRNAAASLQLTVQASAADLAYRYDVSRSIVTYYWDDACAQWASQSQIVSVSVQWDCYGLTVQVYAHDTGYGIATIFYQQVQPPPFDSCQVELENNAAAMGGLILSDGGTAILDWIPAP